MFDPEVLQILGLNLMAGKSPNFAENLGNAGLATMQYQRQQEEDKYRKEEREFLKQQRELQMAQLKREQDFSNAARIAFQPPVTPLTAVDDEGNRMPSSGPSFDFSKLYGIDPAKALALQGQMAELSKKERIKLGEGEKLYEPGPNGAMRLLASGGEKKPTAVRELEFALEQAGVSKGSPAYASAVQTFLTKTMGGFDAQRAQLDAFRAGIESSRAQFEGIPVPRFPSGLPSVQQSVTLPPPPSPAAPPGNLPPPPNATAPRAVTSAPSSAGLPPQFQAPPGLSGKQAQEWIAETNKAFAQDVPSLQSSSAGLARLRQAAEQLRDHPGLRGITGVQSVFPNKPGGDAADAAALLEQLKSVVAFDVLQAMRDASKTGGALGNVSDAEGKRLENNLAALANSQSYEQMQSQLNKIVNYTKSAQDQLDNKFAARYGAPNLKSLRQGASGSWDDSSKPSSAKPVVNGLTVTLPDGQKLSFPSEAALNAFRRKAGF